MSKRYGLEDENGCIHLGFSGSIKGFCFEHFVGILFLAVGVVLLLTLPRTGIQKLFSFQPLLKIIQPHIYGKIYIRHI